MQEDDGGFVGLLGRDFEVLQCRRRHCGGRCRVWNGGMTEQRGAYIYNEKDKRAECDDSERRQCERVSIAMQAIDVSSVSLYADFTSRPPHITLRHVSHQNIHEASDRTASESPSARAI